MRAFRLIIFFSWSFFPLTLNAYLIKGATRKDVGQVTRGETIVAEFDLNLATLPQLKAAFTDCPCTEVEFPSKLSGKSGEAKVRIKIQTSDHQGEIEKKTTILYGDKKAVLRVRANIYSPITVDPPVIVVKSTKLNLNKQTFRIKFADHKVKIQSIDYDDSLYTLLSKKMSDLQWSFQLNFKKQSSNPKNSVLVLKLNDPKLKEFTIPILMT